MALSAVLSAQPSYSEYVFGNSNNAASGGSTWGMSSSLFGVPTISGVDINGVFYRYTATKNPGDPYTVSVQNQNATGSGYIFRETDDWSGGSGGTIQKYVPVPYSPLGDWGEGSIDEVGLGSVSDPLVLYSFRFDPCYDPQLDPNCPGYEPPLPPPQPEVIPYDALSDELVANATAPTDPNLYSNEDDDSQNSDSDESDDKRLEKALAAVENALTIGNSMTQAAILQAMNTATNLNNYYAANIRGGSYNDVLQIPSKDIPDSRLGARVGLAQQVLHEKMVKQQWR